MISHTDTSTSKGLCRTEMLWRLTAAQAEAFLGALKRGEVPDGVDFLPNDMVLLGAGVREALPTDPAALCYVWAHFEKKGLFEPSPNRRLN
jgi:hypothetical protein